MFMLASGRAEADAIIVTKAMTASTIAEIFIDEDAITVELEIGSTRDLEAFRNLLPEELYQHLGYEPEAVASRLQRFFTEYLVFQLDDGPPLKGRLEELVARPRVRRDEITGEPLPGTEDDRDLVFFVRLVYPLSSQPETLTIGAPQDPVADIGFVAYHRGIPVNDFRYLSREQTLRLDWEDPWYSHFDNRNLRRQYDAPMSVFLYVEPHEVRKEIVLRPKDLQHWVDLGLDGKEIIPISQQEEIKQKVADFLADHGSVTVDGRRVDGILDRIHFIRRTLKKTGVIEPPEDLDLVSATLGVIFVYPIDELPQEVTVEWDLFNPDIQKVPVVATDEAGGLPYTLSPGDAVLRWQNFLTNPTDTGLIQIEAPPAHSRYWLTAAAISALWLVVVTARLVRDAMRRRRPSAFGLTAAAALALVVAFTVSRTVQSSILSDKNADTVVTGLLENVYRAFDYRDESLIYDRLERSAAGELLTEIYLETRRSLEIENQGGARAKVKDVTLLQADTTPLDGELGFVSHVTWNVSGSVGHWGHIHQRTNQYEARLTIKAVDGSWKITDLEVLQEQRL